MITYLHIVWVSPAGFKLFTRDTAAMVFGSLHLQRWAFDTELVYICQLMAIPMAVGAMIEGLRDRQGTTPL